jgi:tetratricopeptide (TPR) repeat protein
MNEHPENSTAKKTSRGSVIYPLLVVFFVLGGFYAYRHWAPVNSTSEQSNRNGLAEFIPELEVDREKANSESPEKAAGRSTTAAKASVRLPTVAVPVTVDSLVEESKEVAANLRDMYPDTPEPLHVAAMLHSQIRESAEAEQLWLQCIEMDPGNLHYYVNLSAISMDRGKSQMAAEVLEEAIEKGLESTDLYHHLALAYMNLGRFEEAETTIRKALADQPQASPYRLLLGQAQLKQGNAADAETNLRKAIERGSDSPNAYFALGNACAQQGKKEEAAKAWEVFKEKKASKPLDKQQRYSILATAEARRTAITTLCEAATVHMNYENTLASEILLLRALAIDPSASTPYVLLEQLYRQAQMPAEQRTVLRRMTELDPANHVYYYYLARASLALGEPRRAEAALKMAITMRPRSAEPYATMAQFCLENDRPEKARWYAVQAIRREPTPEGYRFLAVTCRRLGDSAAADRAEAQAEQLEEKRNASTENQP